MYLIYEVQVYKNKATYPDNFLYKEADIVYVWNAIAYTVAALRDLGSG